MFSRDTYYVCLRMAIQLSCELHEDASNIGYRAEQAIISMILFKKLHFCYKLMLVIGLVL